ncbi:MAG TPA: LysM domain-containing protein [Steroidobacteraceae bacterium]|nr:LysM domain-containing protein [Steroidobacteraceae bacterium]
MKAHSPFHSSSQSANASSPAPAAPPAEGAASDAAVTHGDGTAATTSGGQSDTAGAAPAAAAEQPASNAASAAATTAAATATDQAARPLTADDVNPGAPRRYTVKSGDTLWGIASMFLRDPWLWPEIWYVNPQVQNPHLIYPGDVLALAYTAGGRPEVHLEQAGPVRLEHGSGVRLEPSLRSSPLDGAIPTIPYAAISAFLSRPALLSTDQVSAAPHVLAFREEHQAGGAGYELYAMDVKAPAGTRFLVMHIGEKIKDPDGGRVLGYAAVYAGTAVVERPGQPAKMLLIDSGRETLRGDVLIHDDGSNPLNFMPRAPQTNVHGLIIYDVDSVHLIGQYSIVAINRGTRHGVEAGTVLAVDEAGDVVPDWGTVTYDTYGKSDTFAKHVKLPAERAGTLLVFKSYDRMSYALVVGASQTMHVADVVRNP